MQDLTPQFNTAQIKALILKKAKRFEDAALLRLQRVMELALTYYRDSNTWTDQTANLRSSGGYVILKNGEQLVEGGFQPIAGAAEGATGAEGVTKGRKVIAELKENYPKSLVGIMVAGMEYAYALETGHRKTTTGYYYSVYPRDVLTGPSLVAKEALQKAIEELRAKSR